MKALRILLVEDDSMVGMFLGMTLEQMGHEVCSIETTEAGAVAAAGNCSRGWRRGCQATAKFPSMRSRIAWRAGWPLMRAVPVTDRYPAWI
jgi:CheY-like chemotaxis protein